MYLATRLQGLRAHTLDSHLFQQIHHNHRGPNMRDLVFVRLQKIRVHKGLMHLFFLSALQNVAKKVTGHISHPLPVHWGTCIFLHP